MFRFKSIQVKLSLATGLNILLVAVLFLGGSVYFLSGYSDKINQNNAQQGLDGLQLILTGYQEKTAAVAGLAAGQSGIASALAANDAATLTAAMKTARDNGKVDLLAVFNAQGQLVATAGEVKAGGDGKATLVAALQGNAVNAVEASSERMTVFAAWPVKAMDGKVLGAILAGSYFSKDEVVDAVKKNFDVDCSLFAGNNRVATTVFLDGKRVLGSKLDPAVTERVLTRGESYAGEANVLGTPYVVVYQPLLGADKKPIGVLSAGKSKAEGLKVRNAILTTMGGLGLVVLLVSIAFTIWSARKLTKPLQELELLMGQAGAGDLSIKAQVRSEDEIGRLTQSFNLMIRNQADVVGAVVRASSEIGSASEELAASSEEMSATTTEVANNVEKVAADADAGEGGLLEVSKVLVQLSSLIQLAKDRALSAGESSALTRQVAADGRATVSETVRGMEQMKHKILETEDLIGRLSEYSTQIGAITETITSIAGQTNLLALNAAIEAARAGEAGRGFAVVADEVRKLAEQSDQGAREVSMLLGKVTENTGTAVAAARQSRTEMEKVVGSTESARVALDNILKAVDQTGLDVGEILDVTTDEVATSDKILALIDGLGRGIEETAKLAQEVAQASGQTAEVVEGVAASAEELTSMASELQTMVSKFKI